MARLVFLLPFARSEISGGTKTAYRHAEILTGLGYDACLYQPDGRPDWFESSAMVLTRLDAAPDDILVFPETLNGPLLELATKPSPARKVLFCQNQYYMAMNPIPAARLPDLGFQAFAASSIAARNFLRSVLQLDTVALIPYHVDPAIFRPREKTLRIALVPRKMPREAGLIRAIFASKYPQFAKIEWRAIEGASEKETAAALGGSAIFLSLSYLESFGLLPVEAMSSGAIVVGFTGYGGEEYATAENGFWFAPDRLEETADALARVCRGVVANDPEVGAMREAGFATVARFTVERTRDALRAFYGRQQDL